MFLFFPREVQKFYNGQGDLERKDVHGPNHSYNYHIGIGIRL
jgi:hypothetical protein